MFTVDIVDEIVKNRDDLPCHRFGDQAVALWIYDMMRRREIKWYGDMRIHHHPVAASISEFKIRKEICHTFLSLHGSFTTEMKVFNLIQEQERQTMGSVYSIPPVVDFCPYLRQDFNLKWFDPTYYADPIPCKDNPVWEKGGNFFIGRSDDIRAKLKKASDNEARWRAMNHITNAPPKQKQQKQHAKPKPGPPPSMPEKPVPLPPSPATGVHQQPTPDKVAVEAAPPSASHVPPPPAPSVTP